MCTVPPRAENTLFLWERSRFFVSGLQRWGTERIETGTRWTAERAEGDPHCPRQLAVLSPCQPSLGYVYRVAFALRFLALRFASSTSRGRRGTPSGSVTRFAQLIRVCRWSKLGI